MYTFITYDVNQLIVTLPTHHLLHVHQTGTVYIWSVSLLLCVVNTGQVNIIPPLGLYSSNGVAHGSVFKHLTRLCQ